MQFPQHMPFVRRSSLGLGAAVSLLPLTALAQPAPAAPAATTAPAATFPAAPAAPPAATAPAAPQAPAPAAAPPSGAPAAAAPAETLETPYSDVPPPPPAAAPPPAVAAPSGHMQLAVPAPDTRPPVPIRARRRLAFLGEIGWNGLAGFGGILTYNVIPNFALDLGAGGSLLGWKAGVRGRWNMLTTPLTPYLGLGFDATSGFGQFTDDDRNNGNNLSSARNPVTLEVKDSYFMQTVVGIDYTHRRGFTMQLSLGYARLLNKNNLRIIAGHPRPEQQQAYDIVWKSGAVVSSAFGYAFD